MTSEVRMNFEGSPSDFREKFNEEQIDQSSLQSGGEYQLADKFRQKFGSIFEKIDSVCRILN